MENYEPKKSEYKPVTHPVLAGLFILTILALLQSARLYYVYYGNVPFIKTLLWALLEFYLWGILGWVLFILFDKIKISQLNRSRQIVYTLMLAPVAVLLHLLIYSFFWFATRQWFDSSIGMSYESVLDTFNDVIYSKSFYEFLIYILFVSVYFIYQSFKKIHLEERRKSELMSRLSKTELESLKSQLQPHFLFNTLNTITSLIHSNPTQADEMITRLSDLLRKTLDSEEKQKVKLIKEIEYIKLYLDIQQVRFSDRLKISYNIDPKSESALFPNMFLQPFIENSIKHGLADKIDSGEINIKSRIESEMLIISLSDNGKGIGSDVDIDKIARIGIGNSRTRLSHLYGEKARLSFDKNIDIGLKVTIEIPLEYE